MTSFLVLLLVFGTIACSKETNDKVSSNEVMSKTSQYGIELMVEDGIELSMLSPKMSEYLALDVDKTEEIAKFLYTADTSWYYADLATLSWKGTSAKTYDVMFSTSETMENPYVVEVAGNALSIGDCTFLKPGINYYWKVIGNNVEGVGEFSETRSFTIKDETVRIVEIDGVDNVRDIGGFKTLDGKTVKYGMLYRGGRLNPNPTTEKTYLTKEGIRIMSEELGIRSEIDLRSTGDNDGQTTCAFDSNGNYKMWPIVGYGQILPGYSKTFNDLKRGSDSESLASLKHIFEFLANEENYPVYFHCNYGADRTGTLAFLINGLLGVGYEDLVKDFELTSLSPSENRWRSDIAYDMEKGTYEFTEDGVMQSDANNFVAFGDFYDSLMKEYGDGTDLAGAIEKYLIQGCGIKKATLDSVKGIMLAE